MWKTENMDFSEKEREVTGTTWAVVEEKINNIFKKNIPSETNITVNNSTFRYVGRIGESKMWQFVNMKMIEVICVKQAQNVSTLKIISLKCLTNL